MKLSVFWVFVVIITVLSGCAGFPSTGSTPQPSKTPALDQTRSIQQTTSTPLASVSPTPAGPVKLRLWLPPQFDPAANTEAGKLLQNRLDEFRKRRPGIELEVRTKAVYGPGGVLDALGAASAAAPQAVPDLIALPRDLLEAAALKGLLRPYNNLTQTLDDTDWYEYARQLSSIQESIYGLPFAGDALALAYRPEVIPEPPSDWSVAPENSSTLVFPAADPQALFTLGLYQSNDGAVLDDQGRPIIETIALTDVLTYYLQAQAVGMMPELLTQFQSDDQVWEAFQDRRTDLAATWTSRLLSSSAEDQTIAPLPTVDGRPETLATGWVWALSARESREQQAAIELAEFLTDSEFLADWTEAAGFLPTRPSSLGRWNNNPLKPVLGQIALSAHALPTADILSSLGGPLWQATIDVLNQQADPAAAALAASASLTGP
jgi:ABC-type glycerol-3-phosphate transport system substrate-binding protein